MVYENTVIHICASTYLVVSHCVEMANAHVYLYAKCHNIGCNNERYLAQNAKIMISHDKL